MTESRCSPPAVSLLQIVNLWTAEHVESVEWYTTQSPLPSYNSILQGLRQRFQWRWHDEAHAYPSVRASEDWVQVRLLSFCLALNGSALLLGSSEVNHRAASYFLLASMYQLYCKRSIKLCNYQSFALLHSSGHLLAELKYFKNILLGSLSSISSWNKSF